MSSDDRPDTPFEKRPTTDEKTPGGRSRIPVGAILGGFLAVLVILAAVLFLGASCSAGGGNGQTTGTVLLLPVGGP
ncbi:hypothetical protein GCM10023201_01020 [Actinomycetospora corticicola]|uniref:Uncharacterized protein n=1 Tax=Actinomycetospora corticicola TaxID=663602 RepID=A0A7Y9E137_9PSEU|nr:hypothetical protein [Actinomycetospora corticicola]NYD39304.1 hypothetical protein [Actinomycetospora corticicola]